MKIKKDNVINFILLFFLLKPVGMDLYSESLNSLMNILKFISMLYITIILGKNLINGKNINNFVVIMLILETLAIFISIINQRSFYSAIIYWHTILCVIYLAEITKEKNFYGFINISLLVYEIYILINITTIFMWPKGYDGTKIYFLGNKTMHILYILPFLFLQFIHTELYHKKKYSINNIIFILISLYTLYINQSSTSIIAVALSLFYYIFFYRKITEKMFSKVSCRIIGIAIVILGCALILGSSLGGLNKYISGLFGKDITFTGRTYIWASAIQMIQTNVIGYGWDALVSGVTGLSYWGSEITDVGHAHNLLLNLGYKLGIIGLFIYLIFLNSIAKKIDDKDSYFNEPIRNFLKLFFFIFLIIAITESYPTNCAGLYLILYFVFRFYKYKDIKDNV